MEKKSTKMVKPQIVWAYLPIQVVEAHIFGADAALAFSYIRYTRHKQPDYKPTARLLAANVPGLSNHRARFVMECIFQRVYFEESELPRANANFTKIVHELAKINRSYKNLKWKKEGHKCAVKQALEQMEFIRRYF